LTSLVSIDLPFLTYKISCTNAYFLLESLNTYIIIRHPGLLKIYETIFVVQPNFKYCRVLFFFIYLYKYSSDIYNMNLKNIFTITIYVTRYRYLYSNTYCVCILFYKYNNYTYILKCNSKYSHAI